MKKLGINWVAMSIGAIALVSGILSIPIWQQNRYQDLMKVQLDLQKERLGLMAEIATSDLEIGSLSSLTRIEPVARLVGLGFNAIPVKVMEIPRNAEVGK